MSRDADPKRIVGVAPQSGDVIAGQIVGGVRPPVAFTKQQAAISQTGIEPAVSILRKGAKIAIARLQYVRLIDASDFIPGEAEEAFNRTGEQISPSILEQRGKEISCFGIA